MRTRTMLLATCLTACSSVSTTMDAGGDSGIDALSDATPVLDGATGSFTLRRNGVRVEVTLDRFRMRVFDSAGALVLDSLAENADVSGDAVRAYGALGATRRTQVQRAPVVEGWDHLRATDEPWIHGSVVTDYSATETMAMLELADPARPEHRLQLELTLDDSELRVVASVRGSGMDSSVETQLNMLGQSFVLPADEHFFGMGMRFEVVDHRGMRYENWTEEGGLGGGERRQRGPTNPYPNGPGMTGIPMPFFLSSRGYGLWIETTYRTGFVFGAEDMRYWRMYSVEPRLRYRVLLHRDPKDTIAHFTRLTGRAVLPAPWVFGPRRRVNAGSVVEGVPEVELLRRRGVPTTMVDDTMHFLPYGSHVGRETQLREAARRNREWGYRSIGYFNAYVGTNDANSAALLRYGREHNLFVRLSDGSEFVTSVSSGGFRPVVTIDLSNPAGVRWWGELFQTALDLGYDGWMLDFGEYIAPDVRMFDGRSGWEAHNLFPLLMQRAAFDYLSRVRGRDFLYFVRSGYVGTQALTPMVWSGDPAASFDDVKGLPAQVRGGINAGFSGLPYWGSDISGYTCSADPPADKEVYLRWAEFGALSPDMHDENACAGAPAGSPAKWTLWSDAETTEVYGRYARLHTRLFPYLYAVAEEAARTGLPIMRHPWLVHPSESAALGVELEYYFGPALYVAPVVRRGMTRRAHWLPPGTWFDWWDNTRYEGGQMVDRAAPLQVLPMYLRAGSVVALLDERVETLAEDTRSDVTSMADMAGVYDVRAAVTSAFPRASATLVSAEQFSVERTGAGAITLPAGFAMVQESALRDCSRCGRIDVLPNNVQRVRINPERSGEHRVEAGALVLQHRASTPLQVRWDVLMQ